MLVGRRRRFLNYLQRSDLERYRDADPRARPAPVIEPGTEAPEFTLKRGDGSDFTRADLEGKTTVLVFYPFAFSPVCTDQLNLYEEVLDELQERGVTMYGVSCDATYSQTAFQEKLGVRIEQLSDFEPKGAVVPGLRRLPPGRLSPAGAGDRSAPTASCSGAIRRRRRAICPGPT